MMILQKIGWKALGLALVLILSLHIMSCGVQESQREPIFTTKKSSPSKVTLHYIGEIASVNSNEGFVLIDAYRRLSTGKYYYIHQEGREAVVQPSGEKIGSFLAADIIKGEVNLGDFVIARVDEEEG